MQQEPKPLTYSNSWESDTYIVDGKPVKNLTMVVIGGDCYPVESRRVSVPYNDMGHNYSATSTHYFVKTTVFGTIMEFDLNTIIRKVPVTAVEWEE